MPDANWNIAPGETRKWDCRGLIRELLRQVEANVERYRDVASQADAHGHEALTGEIGGLLADLEEHRDRLRVLASSGPSCGRDVVEEQSMESFPASDPPAAY